MTVSDPSNPNYDFGLSSRDVTDRLVVSGLVDLPGGLRLSGAAEYRSGTPWTATDQDVDFTYCGSGFGNCPDARAVINGQLVARNSFRNDSVQKVDMRLTKSFSIGKVDLDKRTVTIVPKKKKQGELELTFAQPRGREQVKLSKKAAKLLGKKRLELEQVQPGSEVSLRYYPSLGQMMELIIEKPAG